MAAQPVPHSPWRRVVGAAAALAALIAIVVLAFSWPAVTADPRDLPIVVAAPASTARPVASALEKKGDGVFRTATVRDRSAAVDRVERRAAYGAIVLGSQPEVLTASAASPVVAQQLAALAPELQRQLSAAVAAQLPPGAPAPTVTVRVTDVAPLASTDSRGAGLTAAAFPIVLGGMIGGIVITLALVGALRRLVALAIYAVVAGAVVTAVLQPWLRVLQNDFVVNEAVFTLALLAIGAPIVGFAALVGRLGVAIGPILFLLFANPLSAATLPVEFIARPWGAVGQWFPPGAGATLIREASYFPRADMAFPWLVLAAWALGGVLMGLVGHFRQTGGATHEVVEEAEGAAA